MSTSKLSIADYTYEVTIRVYVDEYVVRLVHNKHVQYDDVCITIETLGIAQILLALHRYYIVFLSTSMSNCRPLTCLIYSIT